MATLAKKTISASAALEVFEHYAGEGRLKFVSSDNGGLLRIALSNPKLGVDSTPELSLLNKCATALGAKEMSTTKCGDNENRLQHLLFIPGIAVAQQLRDEGIKFTSWENIPASQKVWAFEKREGEARIIS